MSKNQPEIKIIEHFKTETNGGSPTNEPKLIEDKGLTETKKEKLVNLSFNNWLVLVQTIILAITLYYLSQSTKEQARSTQLLAASVEEQARITAFSITPNLGGKVNFRMSNNDYYSLEILITNYSSFPLYVKNFKCGFTEATGWRPEYKVNVVYIPPNSTVEVTSLSISYKDWQKNNEKFGWTIQLDVGTSTGANWEALFRANYKRKFHTDTSSPVYLMEGNKELWLESIKLVDNSENLNKTTH